MICDKCEKNQEEIFATLVGARHENKNLCDECTLREVDVKIIYEITDRVIKFNYFDGKNWVKPWLVKEPMDHIVLIMEEQ